MSEKPISLLRYFGNRSAPSQEFDVNDEGPTTSKNVKGHIASIVELHHSKIESLVAAKQAHGSH